MAATELPLFPRFPLEIQSMIWVASMEPRAVDVTMAFEAGDRPGRRNMVLQLTHNPQQMATVREARKAFLRHYTKLYVSCLWEYEPITRVIYFHPHLDVLSQDFEVIAARQGHSRIRLPGAGSRSSIWPADFFNNVGTLPLPEVPLLGQADPLGRLRHVQVNMHLVVSSHRNQAGTHMARTEAFIQALMVRSQQTELQTVTIRITRDLGSPPSPPVANHLRPVVFRIVRNLPLPISKPNMVFTGLKAEMHLAELQGEEPVCPSLVDILAADAAIFGFRSKADFIALRVIDTNSPESEYDDSGRHWPGAERERMFFELLERTLERKYKAVTTWFTHLLQHPQSDVPLCGAHWGLCGAHYGLDAAKGFSTPTDRIDWPWQ